MRPCASRLLDNDTKITFDRSVFDELFSLRFIEAAHNALVMGPVGVGKTFLATALGHAAIRRHYSVHFERADVLLKRLKARGSTTVTTSSSASCSASIC